MNDRILKRMILEAIQEVLAESKKLSKSELSTSVLERVEGMDDPEPDSKLCRSLKAEHQKHRESAQGGSRTGYPRDKGDDEKDEREYQRGREERKLERRYIAARNKVCED